MLIGLLLLTPLVDLLPVGFWHQVANLFRSREDITYYKIVPSESGDYLTIIILSAGFVMVVIGKYLNIKKRR